MDVVQSANAGFLGAVDKFDPSRQNRLLTFATWRVKGYTAEYIRNNKKTVSIPNNKGEAASVVKKTQADSLVNSFTNRRNMAIPALARATGMSQKELRNLRYVSQNPVTMETQIGQNLTVMDLIEDDDSNCPEKRIAKKDITKKIGKMLKVLEPKKESILRSRFGIGVAEKNP
jgi:RNA polymerase sigma factor (sigma-70 family)